MRDALVIRHVAFEDLGTLGNLLSHSNYRTHYTEAGRQALPDDKLQSTDLLVILGGPISATDENDYPFLHELHASIARRINANGPTLGLCLGAQIIARSLGAAVYTAKSKEIGWSTLELTAAGQNSCLCHLDNVPVLHWHGETFDLPEGAEHLASTPACMNQAFSIGDHLLGLQFHPEVTAVGLESWYIGHTLELSQAGIDIPNLRYDSRQYAPSLRTAADSMFAEWLDN
ncbi:MAG: glutamine amidotransferase [Gammaproteobacteria bacterium]|nr:glutamine amidotransferase [Gammaproteobacteria bacterium]